MPVTLSHDRILIIFRHACTHLLQMIMSTCPSARCDSHVKCSSHVVAHHRIFCFFRHACTHLLQMIMSICPSTYSRNFYALEFLFSSFLACALLLLSLLPLLVSWLFCCFRLFFLLLLSVSWLPLRSASLPSSLCCLRFPPSAFLLLLCALKSKLPRSLSWSH